MDENWYVYIAQARTGRYYVGISPDVAKRIEKHNSGKGSKFAREQGPFRLVYCSGPYKDKSSARRREMQVKKWSHAKKQLLVTGVYQ
jgi:putative endonuclease